MSLISCRECAAQVSSTAINCPHCGARITTPSRGVFGTLVKWLFIGFNLFMLWAVIAGLGSASETVTGYGSDAEKAGAAIGTGIGAMFLLFIWVAGSVILALITLLTRPKK
jgi:hypothetical protein